VRVGLGEVSGDVRSEQRNEDAEDSGREGKAKRTEKDVELVDVNVSLGVNRIRETYKSKHRMFSNWLIELEENR
jgi:hypothetical protein